MTDPTATPTTPKPLPLERKLEFWEVFCLASGGMISSGLFVLPGLAFAQAGPAMIVAYALAGVLVIPTVMSKAELTTAMPRTGGSYLYIERSMGAMAGTLAGMSDWLAISLKSAFALIGIGAFAELLWPGHEEWVLKATAASLCVVFCVLNALSVKAAGRAQVIMVGGLLAILAGFIVLGVPTVEHDHFKGFMDRGWTSVLTTAGMVFVSFGGMMKVAAVAGEVRQPAKNLPRGLFLALGVVSVLYVGATFVTVGTTPADELGESLTPLSLAAGKFLGTGGMLVLSLAAMLAFITTANAGILAASRSPVAMSRDGLLPAFVRKTSRRFHTPIVGIALTGGLMLLVITALAVDELVKVASTMMLILFALLNLAVLILRHSRIQNYRPLYRAPGYPFLQIAGIGVYVLLIAKMGTTALVATAMFFAAGVVWYLIYVRSRIQRESALAFLLKRVFSRETGRSALEDELRQIALERDEVTHDRFDHIIQDAEVVDVDRPITADEMFEILSERLAPRVDAEPDDLIAKFRRREAQSSTVIQPGLAVPHVMVDGHNKFDIIMLRCRDGVTFPEHDEPVRMVFALLGTEDERNFHLRALMAVANIVQEPEFERRWLKAQDPEQLRDLVLLSGRQRDGDGRQ
ncbi:MAG: amino acid permease [Phycisphaerae bacterium]